MSPLRSITLAIFLQLSGSCPPCLTNPCEKSSINLVNHRVPISNASNRGPTAVYTESFPGLTTAAKPKAMKVSLPSTAQPPNTPYKQAATSIRKYPRPPDCPNALHA